MALLPRGCQLPIPMSTARQICAQCLVPVCKDCRMHLQSTKTTNRTVPHALANGMTIGYADEYIYRNKVTWLEIVCASLYWTRMLVWRCEGEPRGHMMHEQMFGPLAAYKFRSHLFSVPMPWEDIYSQLQQSDADRRGVLLPRGVQ